MSMLDPAESMHAQAGPASSLSSQQRYVFEYGHKHCAPPTRTKIDALIAFVEDKEATVRANPKGWCCVVGNEAVCFHGCETRRGFKHLWCFAHVPV